MDGEGKRFTPVRKLSTAEITKEMERLYRQGKTYQEIADVFGVIKQAVQARFVRAGIKRRPLKHQTISKKLLEKLYSNESLTIREIAGKLNTHSNTVRSALKFHGIPKRPPPKIGGIYADLLRKLSINQTGNIEITGKNLQARLHRSAAAVGIKISVRLISEGIFKVTRLK